MIAVELPKDMNINAFKNMHFFKKIKEDYFYYLHGDPKAMGIPMSCDDITVQDPTNWRFDPRVRDAPSSSSASLLQDVEMVDAYVQKSLDNSQMRLSFPIAYEGGYEQQPYEQSHYYQPPPQQQDEFYPDLIMTGELRSRGWKEYIG